MFTNHEVRESVRECTDRITAVLVVPCFVATICVVGNVVSRYENTVPNTPSSAADSQLTLSWRCMHPGGLYSCCRPLSAIQTAVKN